MEPSIECTLELAYRIDIAPKYLNHIRAKLGCHSYWWEYLHEIGHYAVKPNEYIEYWWEHKAPGGVPNMNWFYQDGVPVDYSYRNFNSNDITPDEYGVSAWALSAITMYNWRHPRCSPNWEKYVTKKQKKRFWSCSKYDLKSDRHPLHSDGFEQLKAVGIDFSRNDLRYLRPNVKISIAAQPTIARCFT
ncbi:MAG: hypothetical protein SAJ37_20235 [Oscillatoria sp. PMC 1068.18]|nr:hypothetical protein [Oscillatoria sp. PMC 1076.18]MEC4991070.1 hypothetical protein [Oscillatoria sp. PMC 1068.18]